MRTPDTVTIPELKRLIVELRDHSPDTKIRFRVLGKMWEKNFLQIVHTTTDNAVIVQDNKSRQMKFVSVKDIAEFEIEQPYQNWKPQYHYKIQLA